MYIYIYIYICSSIYICIQTNRKKIIISKDIMLLIIVAYAYVFSKDTRYLLQFLFKQFYSNI